MLQLTDSWPLPCGTLSGISFSFLLFLPLFNLSFHEWRGKVSVTPFSPVEAINQCTLSQSSTCHLFLSLRIIIIIISDIRDCLAIILFPLHKAIRSAVCVRRPKSWGVVWGVSSGSGGLRWRDTENLDVCLWQVNCYCYHHQMGDHQILLLLLLANQMAHCRWFEVVVVVPLMDINFYCYCLSLPCGTATQAQAHTHICLILITVNLPN